MIYSKKNISKTTRGVIFQGAAILRCSMQQLYAKKFIEYRNTYIVVKKSCRVTLSIYGNTTQEVNHGAGTRMHATFVSHKSTKHMCLLHDYVARPSLLIP